jgi:uncharacterized repeat protein (TIGR03803 family)
MYMEKRGRIRSLPLPVIAVALTSVSAIVFLLTVGVSPAAQAQTFSVIHTFTSGEDGASPRAGVTIRSGILYGTARNAGNGSGTVFQILHLGSNWVTIPISLFPNGGANPTARVVFGPDGRPYGTTLNGGNGQGIVFNLSVSPTICKTANCFWKETVLYEFSGSPDGAHPGLGDLVWDQAGNIYGTTVQGGPANVGTVYELKRSGNTWTEVPIYSFSGSDGALPGNGVVFDSNGNLFGTTQQGGLGDLGNVYELKFMPGVGWTQTTVYNFLGSTGLNPVAGLVFDNAGNLYGSTTGGGSGGGGTVFELSPSGDSFTFNLLYSFSGTQECGPWAPLTMDAAGNLYGTTLCDGANNLGSVFKLSNTQNGWVYTSLHDFTGGNDGSYPTGNVTFDTNGNLYGTAYYGGSQNVGTVWMITP